MYTVDFRTAYLFAPFEANVQPVDLFSSSMWDLRTRDSLIRSPINVPQGILTYYKK